MGYKTEYTQEEFDIVIEETIVRWEKIVNAYKESDIDGDNKYFDTRCALCGFVKSHLYEKCSYCPVSIAFGFECMDEGGPYMGRQICLEWAEEMLGYANALRDFKI